MTLIVLTGHSKPVKPNIVPDKKSIQKDIIKIYTVGTV